MSDRQIDFPEIVSSERVYEGWLTLRHDKLQYPSGHRSAIDVIEHKGGVTLLPIDERGRVLLVEQYRHSIGRVLLELPAGTIDPGESPELCAVRELQEETGYKPGRMEHLGGFFAAPGYSTEFLHAYLCTELVESRLQGDEDTIVVRRVALDRAVAMIASGEIEDSKTSAALFLYLQRGGQQD